MEVEVAVVKIGVTIKRAKVYAWGSEIKLLTEGCQFLPVNFHGLVYILLMGAPKKNIPPFSMFQGEMELENFPRDQNRYS